MNISPSTAEQRLRKQIVGSTLAEIRVSGMQLELRFDRRSQRGTFLYYLDLLTLCSAIVFDSDVESGQWRRLGELPDLLDLGRPAFLSEAFRLMGKEVSGVSVGENGDLALVMGSKTILVYLTPVDLTDQDWVWRIAPQPLDPESADSECTVVCQPDADCVLYYDASARVGGATRN